MVLCSKGTRGVSVAPLTPTATPLPWRQAFGLPGPLSRDFRHIWARAVCTPSRCARKAAWPGALFFALTTLWRSLWAGLSSSPGLPSWHEGQESTCPSRRHSFNPRARKTPQRRERLFTPVSLDNSTDRGAWWAAVCGVTNSHTRLSTYPYHPH